MSYFKYEFYSRVDKFMYENSEEYKMENYEIEEEIKR